MFTNNNVYNETVTFDIPDETTIQHSNYEMILKYEDPYKFRMYDVPRAHMGGGSKCTVTNDINILKNVQWYNCWFRPQVKMKG